MSYGGPTPPGSRSKSGRWRMWLLIAAGSVVGLFVVLIAVGLVVNTGAPPTSTVPDVPHDTGLVRLHYGQKATLSPAWTADGIVSATVYGFQAPFPSQTGNHPDAGDQFAVSPVQVCAGSHGASTSNELLPFPFQVVFARNQTFGALDPTNAAKEPDVVNLAGKLRPNACVRGYVTFQYAKGRSPLAVGWGNPGQPAYEWTAVSVDGSAASTLTFTPTDSFQNPGSVTVSLPLKAGDNTVEFGNSSAWAPDFEAITVPSAATTSATGYLAASRPTRWPGDARPPAAGQQPGRAHLGRGAAAPSATDAWAVAETNASGSFTVLREHWNGQAWTLNQS
jgi:hypothetical protein